MFILVERFGASYTFEIPEGKEEIRTGNSSAGEDAEVEFKDHPEICALDAVDACANLLKCVFPELEGHHLEIVCDHPEEDEKPEEPTGDGGIDLKN